MRRLLWAAVAVAWLATAPLSAHADAAQRAAWNRPFTPFKVVGNVYYVGPAGVSAWLITTPKGHVLIDGALEESASQIEQHVEALGFHMRDVKILLSSHAHYDHAGGLADLKRASGARMTASAGDKPILEAGKISFGPSKSDPFPPVKVDRVVRDGDTVALGGSVLTAHLTPGHTPGCTTWTLPIVEAGRRLTVVFYCSTSVAGNPLTGDPASPRIVANYQQTFARLKGLKADVFLGPHVEFFDLNGKRARMKAGGPNPFVDPGELQRFVKDSEADFQAELAKARQAPSH